MLFSNHSKFRFTFYFSIFFLNACCFVFSIQSSPLEFFKSQSATFTRANLPLIISPTEIVLDTIEECETKDFILTVTNSNSFAIDIINAVFSGASKNEFSIRNPNLPYKILANATSSFLVRLSPLSIGSKQATVRLITTDSSFNSNETMIRGEVIQAMLGYSPIGINFGPVNLFNSKDSRIYLVNQGWKNVRITQLSIVGNDTAHFKILNNTAPFILEPFQSYEVIIRFAPLKEGQLRGFLQVNSDDCKGIVTVISLDGIGSKGTIAQIALPDDVRGKPGSKIVIPIRLKNKIPDNPANEFSFNFKYNPTTLLPRDIHFKNTSLVGYTATWKFLAPGIMNVSVKGQSMISDSGIIANIVVEVYIGDAASFPIELVSFLFAQNRPYSVVHDGIFSLDSICQIPKQLIIRKSKALLFQNQPNPFGAATLASNPTTLITYHLNESSIVCLRIFDLFGREMQALIDAYVEAGTHTVRVNGAPFHSGLYFYILETPTERHVKQMILQR